ncbi:hypothetical protein CBR_g12816 [Chara braunii]|uniref:Uncharacterized protein n=1 Tax=Chara braunii TaxID=69332 RepID=A0A388KSR6_CHABU|nr:hypothetical protein CBR_g12816 [Chara braunii]|eukprot:GBG73100.1 hypothetical protein CBR_g12816 [Chara braunii]
MADVFRKLPLLLLAVFLLVVVIVFHVCFLGNAQRRRRRRTLPMKPVRTDTWQGSPRGGGEHVVSRRAVGSSSSACRLSLPVDNCALPLHLQPLPDSSDEQEREGRGHTVPLGSGSTQEWAWTELCGGSAGMHAQSFTELLRPGIDGEEGDGGVNLSSGQSTGRCGSRTRTVIVNPHPGDDGGRLTAVDRSLKSTGAQQCQGRSTSISRTAQGRPQFMRSLSPVYVASNLGHRGGIVAEGGGNLDDVDGRLLWAEQRRELREGREEAIRRGVEHLRMDRQAKEVEEPDAGLPSEEDDDDSEEGGDGNGGHASPSENSDMGGKGGKTQARSGNGRGRPKKAQAKPNDVDGDGEAEEKRKFWSVEHIIALIRAKRDQDAHLQGMGHVYSRMKAREGIDFFQLSAKERASKGFNFNMDHAVYDEIEGSTGFNETINPKNVPDTGASRGVRLPSTSNGDREAVGDADAGAGGDDEEGGSTRGSSQTTGSPGAFGKRKSTRQQTFEAMTDCMEKHGALMAATMESADKRQCSIQLRQCEALEVGVQVQKTHYAASDEVSKLISQAVIDVSAKRSPAPQPRREAVPVVHEVADGAKAGDGGAVGEDDEALVNKLRGQQEDRRRVGVEGGKERALKVETIAKRAIHGWIFKSDSRHKGYHLAYQYALNHAATDIARAMWASEDWRSLVSPMVIRNTLELGMKLPLWFVGANVVDRHQDDECAAYEEAIAQRLVHDFSNVVEAAQVMDSGRVSYEWLKSLAEAMRYLLAAAAWIMRMVGDDSRSHYDSWVFVQLTAKTTLLASMDRHFDSRRHVLQAATVMTDKLGRPPPTFASPPLYIPDWASKCGVTFNHDATLSSPMEATKMEWIGTGPPEEEDDDDEDVDGAEGG